VQVPLVVHPLGHRVVCAPHDEVPGTETTERRLHTVDEPFVGHRQHGHAAGAQDAADLADGGRGIHDVLEHLGAIHAVEGAGREG